jgi:hypothetical protein
VSYDNYTYEAISNILKNKLDQYSIPNIEGGKVKNITGKVLATEVK